MCCCFWCDAGSNVYDSFCFSLSLSISSLDFWNLKKITAWNQLESHQYIVLQLLLTRVFIVSVEWLICFPFCPIDEYPVIFNADPVLGKQMKVFACSFVLLHEIVKNVLGLIKASGLCCNLHSVYFSLNISDQLLWKQLCSRGYIQFIVCNASVKQ